MEIALLILVFVLFVLVIFLLIKNYVLKRDVESMVVKLDANLDKLIAGKKVDNSDNNDDLYSKIAQKLYRLYNINEQKSNEIIEEKEKLNELISDISHQTKTPIANIKLYFEILMSENDVEKRQACLKNIESQIDKLDFLIQSLIKMSRLETGTIKINKEPSLLENTLARKVYGKDIISERHRHRFEYNNEYKEMLENAGLICSGISPNGELVEIVEYKKHPFFIGVQFHPELKSRPNRPAPVFVGLIKAAKEID